MKEKSKLISERLRDVKVLTPSEQVKVPDESTPLVEPKTELGDTVSNESKLSNESKSSTDQLPPDNPISSNISVQSEELNSSNKTMPSLNSTPEVIHQL
jgi:hypothetical protein